MKRKFIMMEIEAGLWGVVQAGSICTLTISQRSNTLTAHLTPVHFIEYTPCMYLQCTRQQWAGQQIKAFTSMYKSVHTGTMKGRVIAITQYGDLTVDVSTQSSMYIKTLANKEKFPY